MFRDKTLSFPQISLRVFVVFRSAFLRWLPYPLNYGKTVLDLLHSLGVDDADIRFDNFGG